MLRCKVPPTTEPNIDYFIPFILLRIVRRSLCHCARASLYYDIKSRNTIYVTKCKSHHKQQQNERIMEVTMAKMRMLMRMALLDNFTVSTDTPTNNNQPSLHHLHRTLSKTLCSDSTCLTNRNK